MIGTDTKTAAPFTPAFYGSAKGAPVFLLRSADIIERGMMEAELASDHRAAEVFPWELRQAWREGILKLLNGDPEIDRLLELEETEHQEVIDAITEKREPVPLPDDDRRLLAEATKVLEQHWPEYRELLARQARRRAVAPIVALRRFCVGWSNCRSLQGDQVEYSAGPDGLVTADALRGLNPVDLQAAGSRAFGMQYGASQAGNSARPSASGRGQRTTNSGAKSKAAGRSKAPSGRKTPA